jgi:hypothetical protein
MNLPNLVNRESKLSLFKKIKLLRNGGKVGISEEFYRPVIPPNIRKKYFKENKIEL